MTKQEASIGLGCKCGGCGNVFTSVGWCPGWNQGCGKDGCHKGTVEPNWPDGIEPPFDDEPMVLYTDKGNIAKSQCPKCGKLWQYAPNNHYYCEEGGCSYNTQDHVELVEIYFNIPIPSGKGKKLTLISFSYKYNVPPGATKVFDVRNTVRNPWKDPVLKKLNGKHPDVQSFVANCKGGKKVIQTSTVSIKNGATIAIGCMGGKHRSVALVEIIKAKAEEKGWIVEIFHRDLDRPREKKGSKDAEIHEA